MRLSRRRFLKGVGVAAGAGAFSYLGLKSWKATKRIARRAGVRHMERCDKGIVLGIDGLDPQVLKMLFREGAVPNFQRLWQDGAGGPLQTIAPAQSPVVWSTLATGTNPARHGVFDFIQREPERPLPFLSICQSRGGGLLKSRRYVQPRRNAALWNILSDHDVPVKVIRWPVTFPAEDVKGQMLSGLGVPDLRGTLGHYTLYTSDAASRPDIPSERVMQVQISDRRIETQITGPQVRGLTGRSEAAAPMIIGLNEDGVTVEVEGRSASLRPRQWSDWVRVRFSTGPLKSVACMVKFYLIEREPTFLLYMTALELDPLEPAFPISAPENYAAQLARSIGDYHTLGMPEDTKALNEHVLSPEAFLEQCQEITEDRFRMFWHAFQRFDAGLLAFVFDTSDRIQHMFWGENELDSDLNVVRLATPIREHYLLMDRFLGELLAAMDVGTGLLVISDHGFTDYSTSFDLNAWLVSEGFMTLKEDLRGREDEESALYRLVDWSRTVAYGCGFSSLYFNMKGREGHGVVGAGERDALGSKLAERLKAYRHAATEAAPVLQASRREEIYEGPFLGDAPDMIIGTSPGYRMSWQTAVGGVCAEVLSPNDKHWSGDHIVYPPSVPGTILSNMPLSVSGASALDVAPTVLAMLGVEAAPDCEGRVLGRDGT